MRFAVIIPGLLVVASLIGDWPAATAADSDVAARCLLAENGAARFPVVVAPDAAESTRQVAAELAQYLSEMTGAKFDVVAGDGARGIVLGTLAQFPDPGLNEALAIRDGVNGREAFAIRTEPDRVRLIGATELGASHAAFRFLESLGCRWFFPARQWTVVPREPKLVAQVQQTDRPAILSRRIWWGYGFFDRSEGRCQAEYEAWARHNGMAMSRRIWCGHAWQSIIGDNQAAFNSHPEYLAQVKGERRGPQLCVSNPAVRQLAVEWALNQLRRRPELDMVSLETADGSDHCECGPCQQLGNISERAFGLANEAARAVAEAFPGKMVGMYAYNDHCEPPSFALEPNVYVQSTAGFIRGHYTFDELMAIWPKHCRNLGFYEYFSVWLWDFDMPPGGRGADVKRIRERVRQYAALGATSVDCESGNNWGLHGRGYYVANRLMWNPDTDVEALLADFYQQAFGPAAAVMQRYYERLDPGNDPLLSEHLLGLALRDLAEAGRLAADHPGVLARLDHLKQYQHYVRLRWEYERTADKARKKELGLQTLTHVYRTRYSYMNHWEAIRQSWVPQLAKEFDEPGWSERSGGEPAWKTDRPLEANPWRKPGGGSVGEPARQTDRPLEANPWRKPGGGSVGEPACKTDRPLDGDGTKPLFRADLEFFQPQDINERTFTADLIPANLKSGVPADSRQQYQKGTRYAMYSAQGEPLELTVVTGVIAWYRDRPDATYVVTDASGKELVRGRLPQDGKEHPLRIEIGAAGLYWFEFNDQAAGWSIRIAAGRPASVALSRSSPPAHLGHMQRMYFFVPRGTKKIEYYWKGGPHTVCGPDGKAQAEVTASGRFVSIGVPTGGDGQAWSMTKLALGHLWFFNVPNYLAASPHALLVPREAVP